MFVSDLPGDVENVFAKYSTIYITSLGNKTLTQDELNMVDKIMPNISPDNLEMFFLANKNASLIKKVNFF
jgi:hypothetical protein